ncbi:MAG: IS1634 family transposase [Candidatus Fermentibacteraceae bacterium]|nr:IS1634 family transposase [Candidatus Fermentibacteraceae bacterium]
MERLEAKKINGHTYYYYSEWGWVNGKCRRKWQRYLGKLEDIVKACEGGGPAPLYADVFQWGLPAALWKEALTARIVEEIDVLCPKRKQGLSTGEYIGVASVNRAIQPSSKRSMWNWFSQTVLLRYLPGASKEALNSQRFWDHMNRIDGEKPAQIWKNIIKGVVKREDIDLSSISYDGTNFYTFIDTFNAHCQIAKHGKNKQGRSNLRQISYALFCSADGHMPLYYDVYEGNRNDAKQFPLMLEKFNRLLQEICGQRCTPEDTTLIFDKGNNSPANFEMIDSMKLKFVGSVKLGEHKELMQISNSDKRFESCDAEGLDGTKAFRVKKTVYGKERVLVVSYNQNLFDAQWLTLQNDISKAIERLAALQQKLRDRAMGLIKKGRTPTVASVEKQCKHILSRQHMKQMITTKIQEGKEKIPELEYALDSAALSTLADTHLGKNIIISNRESWDDSRTLKAYRSQFIIENVFKEMKDRTTGSWWPLNHWTDSKIRVHGLYCTIALLLRALMLRRVKSAGITLSMKRLMSELDNMRQVVNIYPKKRRQKIERKQVVLSRTSELQDKLIDTLELKEDKNKLLG